LTGGATAIPEVQALLRALATGRDVAELGAAYGETAALLAEAARSVVTVEADLGRARLARAWPGVPDRPAPPSAGQGRAVRLGPRRGRGGDSPPTAEAVLT
jgi:hypothetical protein